MVYLHGHISTFYCNISSRKVSSSPPTLLVFLTAAYHHLSPEGSKNKFVHLALQKTFSLALEAKGPAELEQALGAGLNITIVGDNDFYSQQDQARFSSPIPAPHAAKQSIYPPAAQEPQPARLAGVSLTDTTIQPHRRRTRRRSQDWSRLVRSAHHVPGHRSSRAGRLDRIRPARERLFTAPRSQRRAIRALPRAGQSGLRFRCVRRGVWEPVVHSFQPGRVAAADG